MTNERLSSRNQRTITERIIIKGTLLLETPTCFGSGDAEGPTDFMLLRDSISSHALLTGASIAGALRNYVHEYENGYGKSERKNSLATKLFGGTRRDEDGDQSPLIINDSISVNVPHVELRDGVKINSMTGVTEDKAKYDLELLAAGTEFPLTFELLTEENEKDENKNKEHKKKLLQALKIALEGLEEGEIGMGTRKRRGFGRCKVGEWKIWQFDLTKPDERMAWLKCDRGEENPNAKEPQTGKVFNITLFDNPEIIEDNRRRFIMNATFKLAGSLLISSGQFSTEAAPDAVHLKSRRIKPKENDEDEDEYENNNVLSGTSLAGVLRHRAERIVNTLTGNEGIINQLFGSGNDEENPNASRLIVEETVVDNANELVQNRIAIDRFTGGAYYGALFDEQPLFGTEKTQVTLKLELRQPENYEIGLLLLLLKDLWTSDLPVGGQSSIGRGRLKGVEATMNLNSREEKQEWAISQGEDKLEISDAERLEGFVGDFVEEVKK